METEILGIGRELKNELISNEWVGEKSNKIIHICHGACNIINKNKVLWGGEYCPQKDSVGRE